MTLDELFETASCGSSSSGGIASIPAGSIGGAIGFTNDMSASIYNSSSGIKTHRKKRKLKEKTLTNLAENIIIPKLSHGELRSDTDLMMNQLYSFIIKNCKIAVRAYRSTNKFLYRSFKYPGDVFDKPKFFLGRSLVGRRPTNTNPSVQKKLDLKLAGAKFSALRNNSIFCYSTQRLEQDWDNFIIFPVDGFKITWSSMVHDLTVDYDLEYPDKYNPFLTDLNTLTNQQFVQKYKFKNNDLPSALKTNAEILINGVYLAIHSEVPNITKLLKILKGKK